MDMFRAKLINISCMVASPVEVSFPIKDYTLDYQRLTSNGIGSPTKCDCRVAEISGQFEVLSALRGQDVNVDELDYLAKRLDSFMEPEAQQFEGVAAARGIGSIEDFINLTFCCQQATVISDFSDLRAIGRDHYMNVRGGSAPVGALDALDAEKEARELIQSQTGIVTPYGVVYNGGMEIEPLYRGQAFPAYLYGLCVFGAELTKLSDPESDSTWLYFPMPEVCMDRALARGGFGNPNNMNLELSGCNLSSNIFIWIDPEVETPQRLNEAAHAIATLDRGGAKKLCAVAGYIKPDSAPALIKLVEQLDLFEFYPGVSTPEEYGRYMIAESGHFEYDAELDEFYDFEGYGKQRLLSERGVFVEGGYICYNGEVPLEEHFPGIEMPPDSSMRMDSM